MILFTKNDLDFLYHFYNNAEKGYRKMKDRNYEFAILNNNNFNIIDRLVNWFELNSGEKLKIKNTYLFIHKYGVGDYFEKHIDEINIAEKNRAYVVGFHINENYEGGEYKLYNPDFIIDKTSGVPYFFKSDRPHEITKITKGERISALMFINYEDLERKNTLI